MLRSIKNFHPQELESLCQTLVEKLHFDDVNLQYFLGLLHQKLSSPSATKIILADSQPQSNENEVAFCAYSTAVAPATLLPTLPLYNYEEILAQHTSAPLAATAVIWHCPMNAGTGSSIIRQQHKQKYAAATIGAKGTDLYIPASLTHISLAQLKLLQFCHLAREKKYHKIIVQDLIGPETELAFQELWQTPHYFFPAVSYEDYFKQQENLQHFPHPFMQQHFPTLTPEGLITFERTSPGGHGLFAVLALMASYLPQWRPDTTSQHPLLSVISNGEDLAAIPDVAMMEFILQKNIPITMITTDKTPLDLKGGQISILVPSSHDKNESTNEGPAVLHLPFVSIIERAQASAAQQTELFEALGLRPQDRPALFNTNMAIFNYAALVPLITTLVQEVGVAEFLKIIMPTLIENWKEQKTESKKTQRYLQLEGAMGSVLLNLDRYWRQKYHRPLVSFINIPASHRCDFFAPVKTAFDFFMLFYSDRFALDWQKMRLLNKCPTQWLQMQLLDPYYQNVEQLLECFSRCKIINLLQLQIEGIVQLQECELKGNVFIRNKSAQIIQLHTYSPLRQQLLPLPAQTGPGLILEDCTLEIDEEGHCQLRPWPSVQRPTPDKV